MVAVLLKWCALTTGYTTLSLVILTIILLSIHAARCVLIYRTFKKHNIPGPKPTIFFGNFFQLTKNGALPHETIGEWLKKYGKVFGYYDGFYPTLVINDVEVIKEIMIRQFHKFNNRHFLLVPVEPLVHCILSFGGRKWKDTRSLMTPAFSAAKLRFLAQTMNIHADKFVSTLQKRENDDTFDIAVNCNALTLDVIGECALALNVQSQGNPEDEFLQAVEEYFRFAKNPAIVISQMFPFLAYAAAFVNNYLTAGKMTDLIVANLKQVIRTRRDDSSKRRMDILQLLLDSELTSEDAEEGPPKSKSDRKKKIMTDDEVIANAYLFMLAGYETTATALGYVFHLLAIHQDVQDRVYEEILQNVSSVDDISYEDTQKLIYMEQVINEALRCYPPVALFINRVSTEDCVINDVFIPKNVVVQVPVWQLHHDPEIWPEPEKFDPERFSPENKAQIKPGSFMSFGIGPRNCLGMRFSLLEMKVVLCKVLLKYRLTPSHETDNPLNITTSIVFLKPCKGINLKIELRENVL